MILFVSLEIECSGMSSELMAHQPGWRHSMLNRCQGMPQNILEYRILFSSYATRRSIERFALVIRWLKIGHTVENRAPRPNISGCCSINGLKRRKIDDLWCRVTIRTGWARSRFDSNRSMTKSSWWREKSEVKELTVVCSSSERSLNRSVSAENQETQRCFLV